MDSISANAAGFSTACMSAACFAVLGLAFALATSILSKRELASSTTEEGRQLSLDKVMTMDVYRISDSSSAYDALLAMVEYKTGGLPIVDGRGHIKGFISDGDIMRALADEPTDKLNIAYYYALWMRRENLQESFERLKKIPVLSLATKNVISVEETMGLEAVARTLSDVRIKKVPVTKNGAIIGSVSRSDLLRYLVSSAV